MGTFNSVLFCQAKYGERERGRERNPSMKRGQNVLVCHRSIPWLPVLVTQICLTPFKERKCFYFNIEISISFKKKANVLIDFQNFRSQPIKKRAKFGFFCLEKAKLGNPDRSPHPASLGESLLPLGEGEIMSNKNSELGIFGIF